MEQRVLGKTGIKTSVLGFGGAEIGFTEGLTATDVKRVIDSALDSGVNLFDSAAAYLESEKLLGAALQGKRENVTLVTKCGPLDGFSRSDWSKRGLLESIQRSLNNLKTDYLDVVLLHSCGSLEFLWGEAGEALAEAKKLGYAKHIGYSGDGSSALEAIKSGLFEVLETSLSIADQESIDLLLPKTVDANLGVIIKRPLANAAWRYPGVPENTYHQEYYRRLVELNYPFLSTPEVAEVALRFTLTQPGVHTAIVGTTNPERFAANGVTVAKGALPKDEIVAIRNRWKEVADLTWTGQI